MAVRGVIYNDHRGGYIDNVPATFTRKDTDVGIHYGIRIRCGGCPHSLPTPAFCVPPGSPVINNIRSQGNNINPVTYQGVAPELLYKFNEDWDALITQSYQNMDSTGRVLPAAQRLGWRSRCSRWKSRCSTPHPTRTSSRAPPGP